MKVASSGQFNETEVQVGHNPRTHMPELSNKYWLVKFLNYIPALSYCARHKFLFSQICKVEAGLWRYLCLRQFIDFIVHTAITLV